MELKVQRFLNEEPIESKCYAQMSQITRYDSAAENKQAILQMATHIDRLQRQNNALIRYLKAFEGDMSFEAEDPWVEFNDE